ncbi:bifunctional proline dehydrogenase/L-glutamate gamma-semialdehyde dehydrogenase PutA [Tistrella bauzanensis]|uniref:bifunctional proline dehydrogenase/L-glutamate gamma-semialdehyde dehydrogenase PutA n=1 Tax=Tistrella TaxID=171436 RepID=UPI0031F70050
MIRDADAQPFAATTDAGRRRIADLTLADEAAVTARLIEAASLPPEQTALIRERALALVAKVRAGDEPARGVEAFLKEYGLGTREGVVLMCLAESLLRVPDATTADRLIRDKLGDADWDAHLGRAGSLFVNASTWGLMLTGRVVRLGPEDTAGAPSSVLGRLVARSGAPVIRQALHAAMRMMGKQFVQGRTINEALERARPGWARGWRHSFDMLGEGARTEADALRYLAAYDAAIRTVGKAAPSDLDEIQRPSISVKLSALHPRYEMAKDGRMLDTLGGRLADLARVARDAGIGLTVDAEEADRLDPSLDLLARVAADRSLAGWNGLGLAVQAYQKRAHAVIDWVAALAGQTGRIMPVRLVKGAYWDTEIKRAQERGLASFPVFTRKEATDVSYLACARAMLAARDRIYPQFATHNAHTVAAIDVMAGNDRRFEYQRLHGMGEPLYEAVLGETPKGETPKGETPKGSGGGGVSCRIYAPVGAHEDLLPYLVRRLLENGANTSFVHRLADPTVPVDDLVGDPVARLKGRASRPNPSLPVPPAIYAPERVNSAGMDLTDPLVIADLDTRITKALAKPADASAIVGGRDLGGDFKPVTNPADRSMTVGRVAETDTAAVDAALDAGIAAQPAWDAAGGAARADVLDAVAVRFEADQARAFGLLTREAGKTMGDALAEIREAVDFLRYYAARARADFSGPLVLPGPVGESNEIRLAGRGVFACISPWNFPLAIFTGQIAAALAAGNAVVAKPAEQTPLIAAWAVRHMLAAGVPAGVLALLPGDGARIGGRLVADARVAGVAFTGSTETARAINRGLAGRDGPIVPLIAETGGLNAMIVDSSALPEQVVADVLISAFGSAGQRCSALRLLCVQEDVAERIETMLAGAMAVLDVGDPMRLATDVGPVIDAEALAMLTDHVAALEAAGQPRIAAAPVAEATAAAGHFMAPVAYRIDSPDRLTREVFGPVLHVWRYKARDLDAVVRRINGFGYGLTMGVHSRIDQTIRRVAAVAKVGNLYVNRSMIGAVVGTQPFGGEGLSGTGPKAGGPRYLYRFATERVLSVNTAAAGGDTQLMTTIADGGD